jgi:nucleotidyltransferase/DNA polymerase involved in DNA repair
VETERDILHVDMDAFFAAVEQRDRPELRGRPVIVGAPPDRRGVVSTCSYEARAFGVRSAMPSREAGRLCPQGVFLPPDMPRYAAVSRQVFAIFGRYTPLVEGVSIDEAFLDVTGSRRLFGDAPEIARQIRTAIRGELGLTASVGVAGNKFLAKLGSECAKPDGLVTIPRDREGILRFLEPLPASRLWGVGKVLQATLAQCGYRTIGDIQRAPLAALAERIGRHTADHLAKLAFGIDPRDLVLEWEEKTISREHTFPADVRDLETLRRTLADLADDVGRRLRADGRFATVGRLKLRWADFRTITRQRPFTAPCCDDFALRDMALALFEAEAPARPVRLIGFGVTGLVAERREQMSLFDTAAIGTRDRREALSRTVDRLRQRLGPCSVRRGSAAAGISADGEEGPCR